jgi:hypothetical protein
MSAKWYRDFLMGSAPLGEVKTLRADSWYFKCCGLAYPLCLGICTRRTLRDSVPFFCSSHIFCVNCVYLSSCRRKYYNLDSSQFGIYGMSYFSV